jgi:hypothetical protein
MERVDITRLLEDAFSQDDDEHNKVGLRISLYEHACMHAQKYFRRRHITPTPIELANKVLILYNRLEEKYDATE